MAGDDAPITRRRGEMADNAALVPDVRPMRKTAASSRAFGLLLAAVFAIIAGLNQWAGGHQYPYWLAAGAVFVLISLLMPRVLHPLKRLWLRLGGLLNWVVSPVVLTVLYGLSIVPIGLLARLFGKTFLSLERDPHASSYWIKRDPPGPSPASLRNQW
jgi:hypothetical protein